MTTGLCPERLCSDRACHGADLSLLLAPNLVWLWEQIGQRADQRGDAAMTSGTTTIIAPSSAAERAGALGLLGTRVLRPGQHRRLDLQALTQHLRRHGPALTPAGVAAHALGRPVGQRTADRARQAARLKSLRQLRSRLSQALPERAPVRPADEGWEELYRSGRVARITRHPAPEKLLRACAAVLGNLPASGRIDRRVLAHAAAGDPHGLDSGTDLAGLVLAAATASGLVGPGTARRDAWKRLGVTLDMLTGGLLSLGIHPRGWHIPAGHPLVLTPWTVQRITWPAPGSDEPGWVFITENPSITAAALDLVTVPVRLLCTVGTPSHTELNALAHLTASGWRIAVRADFDAAGIGHVRAVLDTIPEALVWRMKAADYTASLHPAPFEPAALDTDRLDATPWDPALATAIRQHGRPAYEEALIDELLTDLRNGRPPHTAPTGDPEQAPREKVAPAAAP
ncbi:DUF2399 domain-containing protein [Streptomyces collinus]|uniref:DUF2399 domain-containing protein n=1 Tax=Streptomyces collinus TaxID=42684 RepID=UPI0037AEA905